MNGINLNNFYYVDSWLSGDVYNRMGSFLYHLHSINGSFVDIGELNVYQPSRSINWSNDATGNYLKYFLNPLFSQSKIISLFNNYFNNADFNQEDIYFADSVSVHSYLSAALQRHCDSSYFREVLELEVLSDTTYNNIYASEDLAKLAHYYKLNCPYEILVQHYYHDTLYTVLSVLDHYSPLDFAKELVAAFPGNIEFGPLGGCSPHRIYLVPQQHHLYGTERLGIRDAKKENRDSESGFSRKLSAKNYEIKDHLGNVVATVSDKKLHPQELTTNGSHEIDTSLGYQAHLTSSFDYYPFGMEISGRSGQYSTVDYSQDVELLAYSGKLSNCGDYTALNVYSHCSDSVYCVTDTNLYGQDYIDSLRIDHTDLYWSGRHKFDFSMDIDLDEVIPNLDTSADYQLDFEMVAQGRHLVMNEPGSGSWSTANYAGAVQIRRDSIKTLSIFYSGKQLDSMANNGVLEIEFKISWGESGYPYTTYAELLSMDIYETHKNSLVAIAKRNEGSYTYGFNGMERDDEVKGSGNSVSYKFRIYDSRIGRFLSVDPLFRDYPFYTPYQFAGNTPIQAIDIEGLEEYSITNYYQNDRLYKTEITIINDYDTELGKINNETLIHQSRVDIDENGNATVSYEGSDKRNLTVEEQNILYFTTSDEPIDPKKTSAGVLNGEMLVEYRNSDNELVKKKNVQRGSTMSRKYGDQPSSIKNENNIPIEKNNRRTSNGEELIWSGTPGGSPPVGGEPSFDFQGSTEGSTESSESGQTITHEPIEP